MLRYRGAKTKYRSKRVWGCEKCGREVPVVIGRKKDSRTCPVCGAVFSVRCFDSKAEFNRLNELILLQKVGDIKNLEVQPVYAIIVEGIRVCEYRADFRYWRAGSVVVEDVKGVQTQLYALKRKLVQALYPGTNIVHT